MSHLCMLSPLPSYQLNTYCWFCSLWPTCIACAFQVTSHFQECLTYIFFCCCCYLMMNYFIEMQRCIKNVQTQYVVLIQVKATRKIFPKVLSVICSDDLCSSLPLVSLSSKHSSHLNGSCLAARLFAFQKNLIDIPEVKDARLNGIYLIM